MDFYIKNKVITLDEGTLPPEGIIGDNTDYVARFIFDEEWAGKIKTAKFIGRGKFKECVLDDNDTCEIPLEILKSGIVDVGVFAGNLKTSTKAMLVVKPSILDKYGLPADPQPDVYAQLLEMIEEIRDKAVSDEEVQEAVNNYLAENPVEVPTTTVKMWSEEDFAEGEEV